MQLWNKKSHINNIEITRNLVLNVKKYLFKLLAMTKYEY
jgi:hypothetical protein